MYDHRCRFCLTIKSNNYYNLFQTNENISTLTETIYRFAGIKVEQEDGLPQTVCDNCYEKIQYIISFTLMIRKSDEKLRGELLENLKKDDGHTVEEVEGTIIRIENDDQIVVEHCIETDTDFQDDINTCIVEEEIIGNEENIPQTAASDMTTEEQYVKDDSNEDLQMVEEILEYVEEVPNEYEEPKENDLLHELAHVAATQKSVQVHNETSNNNSEQFEDECDDEFLIEFNPNEETNWKFKPPKWKCVECKKILRGDVSYEGHMNIHKNSRPHKCPKCHCQFRCRNSLKRHKAIRHNNQNPSKNLEQISIVPINLKCMECNIVFQTDMELLKHQILNHGERHGQTSCPICPNVIVENLLNHLESVHTEREYIEQQNETTDVNEETILVARLSDSATTTYYNCHMCSKTFTSLAELNRHRKTQQHIDITTEHNDDQMSQNISLHCDLCPEVFTSLIELNKHRKLCCYETNVEESIEIDEYVCYSNNNSMDSMNIVQCEICKKTLQRKNLTKHMLLHKRKKEQDTSEGSTNKLLCAYCPREFKNTKTLNQHEKIHRGETADIVYVCADCDLQYSSQILLETHRKQAHKERDHVCSICGNAFKLKNQLVNHMKLHLEKNIQCPHCEKKYARQFDLNVHLRSHTGELPYECHLCDKRFAIKVRLTYHLQRHYGIKHQCKECNAEFNSRQKLKAHSFKHTGMPYRCELCDDHGFPNRVVFKRHLDRVHHAEMTDEALNEMFQRNTGKTIKIKQIKDINSLANINEDIQHQASNEKIIEDGPVLISSTDIVMESEEIHD